MKTKANNSEALKLRPHKRRIKRTKAESIFMTAALAIFIIYSITMLFPFAWCLLNTFKTRKEFINNIWGFPKVITFRNWINCFNLKYNDVNILGMVGNSLFFAIACTLISTYFSACTAYAIAKFKFPGSRFLYIFAFMLMFIPAVGAMAANYKLYNDLGLYDRYIGILVGSCSGFGTGFIYLYAFFKNIPWEYAEAAQIDGAGNYTIFYFIMIPIALPSLSAIMIMNVLGIWNEYFTFYMYAPSKVTLALGLYGLVEQNSYGKVSYPELFAAMLFSIVPAIIIYTLSQKLIVKNVNIGGLKA